MSNKSKNILLFLFSVFHYSTPLFLFPRICFSKPSSPNVVDWSPTKPDLALGMGTLVTGNGRMDCCYSPFAHYLFLFIINLLKCFHSDLSPSNYVFFPSLLANSGMVALCRHAAAAIAVTLWWPHAARPYARWRQGRASFVDVSLLCCTVKILLMHLRFHNKIYIILSNTSSKIQYKIICALHQTTYNTKNYYVTQLLIQYGCVYRIFLT